MKADFQGVRFDPPIGRNRAEAKLDSEAVSLFDAELLSGFGA